MICRGYCSKPSQPRPGTRRKDSKEMAKNSRRKTTPEKCCQILANRRKRHRKTLRSQSFCHLAKINHLMQSGDPYATPSRSLPSRAEDESSGSPLRQRRGKRPVIPTTRPTGSGPGSNKTACTNKYSQKAPNTSAKSTVKQEACRPALADKSLNSTANCWRRHRSCLRHVPRYLHSRLEVPQPHD